MYSVLKLFGFGTLFYYERRNHIEKQLFQIYKASKPKSFNTLYIIYYYAFIFNKIYKTFTI